MTEPTTPTQSHQRRRRPILVGEVPHLSWPRRAVLLSGIFAGVWVFLDPLFTLAGGASPLLALGLWGYAGLIVVSAVGVVGAEAVHRRTHLGRLDLIDIEILLTNTGQRFPVRAPHDMLAGRLVDVFLVKVARQAAVGPLVSAMQSLYDTNLLVERDGAYRQVSNRKTLREAGVIAGDTCKIRGYIRREYQAPVANILAPVAAARIQTQRAEGRVFLDEDVALDLDTAVARGILTAARAAELKAGSPEDTRFFVVDNTSESNKGEPDVHH